MDGVLLVTQTFGGSNMNVGGKSKERFWLLGLIATLALVVGGPAYAQQGIAQNLEDSFELHGYVENQEIIRNENYVKRLQRGVDSQPNRLAALGADHQGRHACPRWPVCLWERASR